MYETKAEREAFFRAFYDLRLDRLLGEGTFGWAFLVYDETEKIHKVVKLPKSAKTNEALRTEGDTLRRLIELSSPHIIRMEKLGRIRMTWEDQDEERYYLILAYGGTSLRSRLGDYTIRSDDTGNPRFHGSGKALPAEEALRIASDVCQGLVAAHGFIDPEVRLIHRDIKPENILIDEKTGVARLSDFGIARVIDRSSALASGGGTPIYMSPECFDGHACVQSDLYSLGVVLYEMLRGDLPFHTLGECRRGDPPDLCAVAPQIPEAVGRIVVKAMAREVSRRYQSAQDLLADLRRAQANINPLPPGHVKLAAAGVHLSICQERVGTGARLIVQVVESDADDDGLAAERRRVESCASRAAPPPLRHFRNEGYAGLVWAEPKGRPWSDWIKEGPPRTPEAMAALCATAARLCDALAEAHGRGVVVGHLAPALIYVEPPAGVTLVGAGMAPLFTRGAFDAEARALLLASLRDRWPYLSPRVMLGLGAPMPADDLYSLGATLFESFAGRPWAADGALEAWVRGGPRPGAAPPREHNPLATRKLAGILLRALETEGHGRFATAAAMAAALRRCRWPDDLADTAAEEAMQVYERGDTMLAYEMLERALAAHPGYPYLHFTRGLIYLREGEHRWALEELTRVVEVAPTREAWAALAQALHGAGGRGAEAVRACEAAIALNDGADLRELAARASEEAGNRGAAIGHLRIAIAGAKDAERRQSLESLLAEWTRPPRAAPAAPVAASTTRAPDATLEQA